MFLWLDVYRLIPIYLIFIRFKSFFFEKNAMNIWFTYFFNVPVFHRTCSFFKGFKNVGKRESIWYIRVFCKNIPEIKQIFSLFAKLVSSCNILALICEGCNEESKQTLHQFSLHQSLIASLPFATNASASRQKLSFSESQV